MASPTTADSFVELARRSGLVDEDRLNEVLRRLPADTDDPRLLARALVRQGLLTAFQARHLLKGKWRGFTIAGKYKLLDLLGRGGMGFVYLCEHTRLNSLVALKLLPPDKLREPAALERFYREARATASLNHPNVVRTHDIGEDDGSHFMVMEYVDGCDLQQVVERVGPLPPEYAAYFVVQAALGLQHAHANGWVHRDIKPANLLLSRQGVVKVSDYGLARLLEDGESVTSLHANGAVLGTADYLAPEQSINSSKVDIRADIYGLGGVLYFLLAGRSPVGGGTVKQKLMNLHTRAPEPIQLVRPEIPDDLAAVLGRMLARSPADRFSEPVEAAAALSRWASEAPPVPAHWLPPPPVGVTPADATPPPAYRPPQDAFWHQPAEPAPSPEAKPPHWAVEPLPPPPQRLTPARLAGLAAVAVVAVLSAGVAYMALSPRTAADPALLNAGPVDPEFWKSVTAPRSGNPPVTVTGRFENLTEAVRSAVPGDWIWVVMSRVEGTLEIDGTREGNEVVIQGIGTPATGLPVWTAPEGELGPLLRLSNVKRVVVKNFVFDGGGRLDTLAEVRGNCPGLHFENVVFRNFRRRAVVLADCSGDPDEPVTLGRLRLTAGEAGVALSGGCRHVTVADCRFEGAADAAVVIDGPAAGVRLRRNRFYECRAGVRSAAEALRLCLESNTLSNVADAVVLDRLPAAPDSDRLALVNNLLVATHGFVRAPAGHDAGRLGRLLRDSGGNAADCCGQGELVPPAKVVAVPPLPTDPEDEARFLRYPAGSPLATAGLNRRPVGLPPETTGP